MPIFFQHQINANTRLGVWKIEETEEFFLSNVPLQKEVTHPHKRLQHLAGRFLLQFLCPDFPYAMIQIAGTLKPYLPDDRYHFSISHCADYAAAIVSSGQRVGIDIEISSDKAERIKDKFLTKHEQKLFEPAAPDSRLPTPNSQLITLLWCCKEAVYKWYGDGSVDFRRHIRLQHIDEATGVIHCYFGEADRELLIHFHNLNHLVLAWIAG